MKDFQEFFNKVKKEDKEIDGTEWKDGEQERKRTRKAQKRQDISGEQHSGKRIKMAERESSESSSESDAGEEDDGTNQSQQQNCRGRQRNSYTFNFEPLEKCLVCYYRDRKKRSSPTDRKPKQTSFSCEYCYRKFNIKNIRKIREIAEYEKYEMTTFSDDDPDNYCELNFEEQSANVTNMQSLSKLG